MPDLVGLYYDSNGALTKIVHADNDDFSAHADPTLVHVRIAKAVYDTAPLALSLNGRAEHLALDKLVVAAVSVASPAVGLKLQARITAIELAIAASVAVESPLLDESTPA